MQLSKLAEDADNVLDKVDYYRIRDDIYHIQEAGDADGLFRRFTINARHALGKCRRSFTSSLSCRGAAAIATAAEPRPVEAEEVFFNRSMESERIKSLMAQMQPLCAKISNFLRLELMGGPTHSSSSTAALDTAAAFSERVITTTSTSLEANLYGRQELFYTATKEITGVREGLTVLPVLGPGGIGKTTFAQHLFNAVRVKKHFHVRIWVHVSLDFDMLRLTKEIFNSIVSGEQSRRSINVMEPQNLEQLHRQLEQMLQFKRFLLILDDVWSCGSEYKWNRFLAPFKKTMVKGSTVIVTTRSEETASMVKSGTVVDIRLDGLGPEAFWAFFLACAFGDQKPADNHKELLDIGREIVQKLKFSPLAAKTVGRLLKKDLSRQHWSRVLDSKAWENGISVNEIMPALKLSYDCLPFHLQKCFTFCALFPDDYQYQESELTHLWSALGVINCSGQNDRIRDIGMQYINGLLNSGIFQKVDGVKFSHEKGREVKHTYYVMHGLFHELARIISSRECLSIDCSNPSHEHTTPPSIRHLSIRTRCKSETADTAGSLKDEIINLKEQVCIANLHTLMFIGEFDERFSGAFKEVLQEIKHVRVLHLFQTMVEFLSPKLIHLRYLKIQASQNPMYTQLQTQTPAANDPQTSLPSSLPKYYHLRFLDLQDWTGMSTVPEHMHISHLIHLRQFLASKELQSSVAEVGKIKPLQELKKFQVQRENRDGFGLQQLGQLRDLGGALTISNLHKVKTRAEAEKAKLKLKRNLVRLKLVWDEAGTEQTEEEANSIEGLQPPENIRELCIKNHKGKTCPVWCHSAMSFKVLEVLHLHGVSWNPLPPFEQIPYLRKLKLENIAIENFETRGNCLENLKSIEFIGMLSMKTWVSTNLFTQLEQLKVSNCPQLIELPFSQNLQLLQTLRREGSRPDLQILRMTVWRQFQAFPLEQKSSTMPNLRELVVQDCPELYLPPLPYTSNLSPLPYTSNLQLVEVTRKQYKLLYNRYTLEVVSLDLDSNLCALGKLDNGLAFHHMQQLVRVTIKECSSVPLTTLQKLGSLEELAIEDCSSLSSGIGVNGVVQISIKHLVLSNCNITGKELSEILVCCPCLSLLEMEHCTGVTGLCMQKSSHGMDGDSGTGMLRFPSKFASTLRRLFIFSKNKLDLTVKGEVLSELVSLQWLQLGQCVLSSKDRCPANDELPLENNLKVLRAYGYDMHNLDGLMTTIATVMAGSKQLEELDICSISGVLDDPICRRLSDSLRRLTFRSDILVKDFTEAQDMALRRLTSVEELVFYGCNSLQSLPPSLRFLPSLKKLEVSFCHCEGDTRDLQKQCSDLRQDIKEVVLTFTP
ncbi:putative disease resistance protein RGA3 [Oryza brachyantha]|uniref:Uncharacterized protein n=1 Tax=Oryza brachyantha TaxID=4533 RepID=J3N0P1_ORYBR|nr:putative disease resistance protein RGA3 [Oryza brachyantha]